MSIPGFFNTLEDISPEELGECRYYVRRAFDAPFLLSYSDPNGQIVNLEAKIYEQGKDTYYSLGDEYGPGARFPSEVINQDIGCNLIPI